MSWIPSQRSFLQSDVSKEGCLFIYERKQSFWFEQTAHYWCSEERRRSKKTWRRICYFPTLIEGRGIRIYFQHSGKFLSLLLLTFIVIWLERKGLFVENGLKTLQAFLLKYSASQKISWKSFLTAFNESVMIYSRRQLARFYENVVTPTPFLLSPPRFPYP